MSRSALWRQETNVIERQRQANETFELAIDEGRVRSGFSLIDLLIVYSWKNYNISYHFFDANIT